MWEVRTRDSLHYLDLRDLDAPMWRRTPVTPRPDGRIRRLSTDEAWVPVWRFRALPSLLSPREPTDVRDGLPEPLDHLILDTPVGRVGTSHVTSIRRLPDPDPDPDVGGGER